MKKSFPEPLSPHHRSRFYPEHPVRSSTECSDTHRPAASEQLDHACSIQQSSSFYPIRPTAGLMTDAQNNSLSSLHCLSQAIGEKSPRISPNPGFDTSIPSRVQWPCTFKGTLQLPTGQSPSPIRRESLESSPESTLPSWKSVDDSITTSRTTSSSLQKI